VSSHHHYRHILQCRTKMLEHLNPIQLRQLDIQENKGEQLPIEQLEGFSAILCPECVVAGIFQLQFQNQCNIRFIIDDQNPLTCHMFSPQAGTVKLKMFPPAFPA
jgi:hypothetical protein